MTGAATFSPGCVLAFDVGRKIVGVAVGQRALGTARALGTFDARDGAFDWPALDAFVADWQPECFVVGLPLRLDGGEQDMTRFARGFAKTLGRRHARPVYEIDERHTSREASRRFATQRAHGLARRKHAESIDALAAQVILESWMSTTTESSVTPS